MQAARDALKKESVEENCSEKYEAYKRLRNRINARLEDDEKSHYENKLYQDDPSVSMFGIM